MSFSALLFYILTAILLVAAVRVVSARHPVHAALSLALTFFTMAVLWITLGAEFLGLALVVIYVGAVMVLFLFVLMLLDIRQLSQQQLQEKAPRWRIHLLPALLVGAVMLLEMGLLIVRSVKGHTTLPTSAENTRQLGTLLFQDYLFPLELIAVLLLSAMIAAIALTHRQRTLARRQEPSAQIAVRREDRVRLVSMAAETESAGPTEEDAGAQTREVSHAGH